MAEPTLSRDRELEIVSDAWERHKLTDAHKAAMESGGKSGQLWSAFLAGWDARINFGRAAQELLAAANTARDILEEMQTRSGGKIPPYGVEKARKILAVAIAKATSK